MNQEVFAAGVIDSLRRGIPPQHGVMLYSVGHEKLIEGIKKRHFNTNAGGGIIRFVNGTYGSGKTHFFRVLREAAFYDNRLVSTVEVNKSEAPFNKFERILYAVFKNINSPEHYFSDNTYIEQTPFKWVIRRALAFIGSGTHQLETDQIQIESYQKACEELMKADGIDIDFKKMVKKYWDTFLPEAGDITTTETSRGEILQWFAGEGSIGSYRRKYDVNKMVSRENAKEILSSLAEFIRLAGYKGLVILIDEAEQSYSTMKKSQLREAQNNLLHLINTIDNIPGLFLIYATTPDFYFDPKHGIATYPALMGRIRQPIPDKKPKALDLIWNLDAIEIDLDTYQQVAQKIREIYTLVDSEAKDVMPNDTELNGFVMELSENHSPFAGVRFWRVLVTALVMHFDDLLEGDTKTVERLYEDVMDILRED